MTGADPRADARRDIIQAANLFTVYIRMTRSRWGVNGRCLPCQPTAPYAARHIQRCVQIVRQHDLVPPETLVAAGFRPSKAAS